MIKHDQGITCTLMTILLIAALSYLSVNAQEAHAVEQKTAELVAADAPLDAPNPQTHGTLMIDTSNSMVNFPMSIVSAVISSENGSGFVAHLWQNLPSYLWDVFSHR